MAGDIELPDLFKALKSIDSRGKAKTLLAADYKAVHDAVGKVAPGMLIVGRSPLGTAPPTPVVVSDTQKPTIPTGVVVSVVDATTLSVTADPVSDPTVGTTLGLGVASMKLYKNAVLNQTYTYTNPGAQKVFTRQTIGTPTGGSSSQSGADLTLTSNGTNIYYTVDDFEFLCTQTAGDMTLVCKVDSFALAGDPFAKFGLMIRESLGVGSKYAFQMALPLDGAHLSNFEFRDVTNGSASQFSLVEGVVSAVWLKLVRVGTNFKGYYSLDGNAWTLFGTATITMSDTVYAGIAACKGAGSTVTGRAAQFNYTNLAAPVFTNLTGLTTNTPVAITVTSVDLAGNESLTSTSVSGTPVAASGGVWNPAFPRISYQKYGAQDYTSNSARRARYAIADLAMLEIYRGMGGVQTALLDIKNLSTIPTGTKIGKYIINEAIYKNQFDGDPTWWSEVLANDWVLKRTDGTPVDSWFGSNLYTCRNNSACRTVGGLTLAQRFADYTSNWLLNNSGSDIGGAATSLDLLMHDNFFASSRVVGDWLYQGINRSPYDADVSLTERQGFIQSVNRFRGNSFFGSRWVGGNTDWTSNSDYNGLLDMVQFEAAIGEAWSSSEQAGGGYAGWQYMLAEYRQRMACLKSTGPKIVHFTTRPTTGTSLQEIRYHFGSCLLDDGYYCPDPHTSGSVDAEMPFFDEITGGGLGRKWLGYRVSAKSDTAWSQGCYRQDFDNGIVIVNPKGNGTKTLALGGTFYILRGNAAAGRTAGAAVTSVTLVSEDSCFLSKNPT